MKKIIFRTPHPSAKGIKLGKGKLKVVVRHGASSNSLPINADIEINSLEKIRDNADKLKMKQILEAAGVLTPPCLPNTAENREIFKREGYNCVFKKRKHKRSIGMEFLPNEEIDKLADDKYKGGIIEKRILVRREWRIHCAPSLNRFYALEKRKRHDYKYNLNRNLETCVFREEFEIPERWQEALDLTKQAIIAVGLDVACVDIAWTGKRFQIIEVNSASGLGDKSKLWYEQTYKDIIEEKIKEKVLD